ncbi:hypothetical protein [Spirosoma sp. KNUC1025]|uniref:hypothetical protein n=1 Tax=Spirosoma sp. KNUC1025 TaxID=2894082 RepID=UPI00386D777B|nr:hypothetical protein LN737_06810 [Spirosoma sp. KNUC1025]
MRYRELFTVEVLHDYFADGKAGTMLFTPTPSCEAAMAGAGLRAKSYDNRLYVIAQTQDGLKPFRDLPQPGVFSFYVQPADADFFQYSNLPLNSTSGMRYYFSNLEEAVVDGKNYLHKRHPDFNAANAYTVGQFVRSGTGNCYECLVNLATGTSTLNNTSQWRNHGKVSYADASHGRSFTGSIASMPVSPASDHVFVEIFGLNATSLQLDVLQMAMSWTYEKPVSSQPISLGGLPEGMYRIRVNAVDNLRYYASDNLWTDNIGLIQIFTNATVPADYQLLDGAGQFRSPVFSIRVAAVSPLWQYVARTDAVKKVYDQTANGIEFETVAPFTFRSKLPVPLQEKAYDKLAMEYNNSDPPDPTRKTEITKLTVPGYRNKRAARKDNTDYFISEIYLNY